MSDKGSKPEGHHRPERGTCDERSAPSVARREPGPEALAEGWPQEVSVESKKQCPVLLINSATNW